MSGITKRQIQLLRVAQRKLDISDGAYRTMLAEIAGVTSTTELDREGFEAMMGFFEFIGFQPLAKNGPDYGDRPGMASFAQLELIRALWREWTRGEGTAEGLTTWTSRTFKVSSLRFLTKADAAKAITALKAMKAHAA